MEVHRSQIRNWMQSIIFQKLDVFGHPLGKSDAGVVQFS